jgi:diadenylate cyclase
VVAASCYLPLSENVPSNNKSSSWGTRHRAALGISEQADCLVVVISEETGRISVAQSGLMKEFDSDEALKKMIVELYSKENIQNTGLIDRGAKDVIRLFKKKSGT